MTTDANGQQVDTTAIPRDGIVEKRGLSVNANRPGEPVPHAIAMAYIQGGDPAPQAPAAPAPSDPATSTPD